MILTCPHCLSRNRVPDEKLVDQPICGRCQSELFKGEPISVDGAGLSAHISKSDLPVLVDFWAPWCGPCQMMAPEFQKAASALEPRVRLLKLNTEAHPEIGGNFNIRSIPTLVLFKSGKEVGRQSGAMSSPQMQAWVRSLM